MDVSQVFEVLKAPHIGIIPALMFLGWLLKQWPEIPNRVIPVVLAITGVCLGVIFISPTSSGALVGFLMASVAIGVHSGVKNSLFSSLDPVVEKQPDFYSFYKNNNQSVNNNQNKKDPPVGNSP